MKKASAFCPDFAHIWALRFWDHLYVDQPEHKVNRVGVSYGSVVLSDDIEKLTNLHAR